APAKTGGGVMRAELSADGSLLLTGCDGAAGKGAAVPAEGRVWEAATGKAVSPPLRPRGQLRDVAFSPDGRPLLTQAVALPRDAQQARGEESEVQLWDARSGERLKGSLKYPEEIAGALFSPDGRRLLAYSGLEVFLSEADSGKVSCPPLQHSHPVQGA